MSRDFYILREGRGIMAVWNNQGAQGMSRTATDDGYSAIRTCR